MEWTRGVSIGGIGLNRLSSRAARRICLEVARRSGAKVNSMEGVAESARERRRWRTSDAVKTGVSLMRMM